ncbi:MAG: hypothetical protein EP338_13855 [Bacteroidetes bacterium]|nr:MAG: hypothetical protein EP338_13855 [Bacteroidota bacterium]
MILYLLAGPLCRDCIESLRQNDSALPTAVFQHRIHSGSIQKNKRGIRVHERLVYGQGRVLIALCKDGDELEKVCKRKVKQMVSSLAFFDVEELKSSEVERQSEFFKKERPVADLPRYVKYCSLKIPNS